MDEDEEPAAAAAVNIGEGQGDDPAVPVEVVGTVEEALGRITALARTSEAFIAFFFFSFLVFSFRCDVHSCLLLFALFFLTKHKDYAVSVFVNVSCQYSKTC